MPKVTEEHKEQREHQVLMAAMAVFTRKGYEKTTLKDIVEEAGMSRGWIYLYFPDKIEIFLALMKYLDIQLFDQLSSLKSQNSSVWNVIKEYLQESCQSLKRIEEGIYPAIYEFCISGWREPKIRDFFSNRYKNVTGMFADLLKSGIESGEFDRNVRVEDISKVLVTNLDGIIMHCIAFGASEIEAFKQMAQLENRIRDMLNFSQPHS